MQYDFDVYDPLGPFLRAVPRSQTFMRSSGWRGSLTPDQGCREATWKSIQKGLGLRPLDVVRVHATIGGVRTPIFYGELRQGGNAQDVLGEDCVLRGLHTAFREVPLRPGSYPEMDAGTLFRTALRDCISLGYFGTPPLITVADADFPPLNFTLSVTNTFQKSLQSLLDRILEQSGQADLLEAGVRPDGSAYLRVKKANDLNDVYVITAARRPEWKPPVQEVVATRVLWYLEQKDDGTWAEHTVDHPDAARYRIRQVDVQVPADIDPWVVPENIVQASDGVTTVTFAREEVQGLWYANDDIVKIASESDTATVYLRMTIPDGAQRFRFSVRWYNGDAAQNRVVIDHGGTGTNLTTYLATDLKRQDYKDSIEVITPKERDPVTTLPGPLEPGTIVTVYGVSLPTAEPARRRAAEIQVSLLWPVAANAPMFAAMSRAYFQLPVLEPGRLTEAGLIPPGNLRGHVQLGEYTRPVQAWEYTIESSEGVNTHALTDQADDPRAVALQQLVRFRDRQATMAAVEARR
ncbi:hypothetical protein GCM10017784_11140 [Deinococcus indicus]|uniref:hypothetical protein n=1 Tax=Deinococcus indicus TaxID=223556 RepID=UPI00174934F1|nr:hypothetical protein [Deinococcus indicus]GHG21427.1 hypothetical protein GCM10017784_11140 [Deinococcus indicus]